MNATARPWSLSRIEPAERTFGEYLIRACDRPTIVAVTVGNLGAEEYANACLIVTSVNHREVLVRALRKLIHMAVTKDEKIQEAINEAHQLLEEIGPPQ